jgi:hypothetical protein
MRFRFIEDRRADCPVRILCDVLEVSLVDPPAASAESAALCSFAIPATEFQAPTSPALAGQSRPRIKRRASLISAMIGP